MNIPKLTLSDLKKELNELRGNFHNFHDDDLFVLWFLKAYVTGNESLASSSVCGGGNDKGLDAVLVEDDSHSVFLVQAKYRRTVGKHAESRADVLDFARMGQVLSDDDDAGFKQLLKKADPLTADRLVAARDRVRKRDYRLSLYYITLGKVSGNLRDQAIGIARRSPCQANLEILDGRRLMVLLRDYMDDVAPLIPSLDLEIESGGDTRVNGILQRYDNTTGIESWVFPMNSTTLADIYSTVGRRLFARNIRGFLGEGTPVNRGMIGTLDKEADYFFYYNNGITIVCDRAEKFSRQGRDLLRVNNPQVINGQQTTVTIAGHANKRQPASVLVKVIQVPREENDGDKFDSLVSRIVACTNWQNAIRQSDLMANERRQIEIEREFRKQGYLYLRKRQSKGEAKRHAGGKYFYAIKKEELATAVAGCNLDPVIVRSGKENLFEEDLYATIFPNSDPLYYLTRFMLFREVTYCAKGYPQRGYAKWLVLGFVWSFLSPLVRSGIRAERFRDLCQRQNGELMRPLNLAIEQAFVAAIRYYKRNSGTGETAVDVSTFFRNKKGRHVEFRKFWESRHNKNRQKFLYYWRKAEAFVGHPDEK